MAQQPPGTSAGGGAPVGFDGVQGASLGPYPPVADAKPTGGYPTVAPVSAQLPPGYPGAPAGSYAPGANYAPAGAPPPGGRPPGMAVVGMPIGAGGGPGMPPGMVEDKIGPMGMMAWGLFIIGIFFPITWMVCSFLPICAKRSAKGPKDFKAVRTAAISSSIALCFYLVMIIILMTVGRDSWQRRVCVDKFGNRYYCSRKLL